MGRAPWLTGGLSPAPVALRASLDGAPLTELDPPSERSSRLARDRQGQAASVSQAMTAGIAVSVGSRSTPERLLTRPWQNMTMPFD